MFNSACAPFSARVAFFSRTFFRRVLFKRSKTEDVNLDLVIKNGLVMTINPKREIIRDGAVAINEDKIVAVGKTDLISREYSVDVELDAKGKLVMPGLIDTHTHLYQTLGKGLGDDKYLLDWHTEARIPLWDGITEEDWNHGIQLGCLEAIKSGTTSLLAYEPTQGKFDPGENTFNIFRDSGIRAVFGFGLGDRTPDMPKMPGEAAGTGTLDRQHIGKEENLKKCEEKIMRWNGKFGGRLQIWPAPGAVRSCSYGLLKGARELADKYGVGYTIHVDEPRESREFCKMFHQSDCESELLYKLGVLAPNVLAVHCTNVTDKGVERFAETNTKVSHNPTSNMYVCSGVAPIPKMLSSGVTVGLGADGALSNNNQDIFEVMKICALLHKVSTLNPAIIKVEKLIEMATLDGAKALMMEKDIGSIEAGKKADIIIIDLKKPNTTSVTYPPSSLVYSAHGENVDTVIIDGRVVMQDRKVKTMDENKVLKEAQESTNMVMERSTFKPRAWRLT
jgi:5-methylthioadenosine/S-adenosylhomocysteine deaminase